MLKIKFFIDPKTGEPIKKSNDEVLNYAINNLSKLLEHLPLADSEKSARTTLYKNIYRLNKAQKDSIISSCFNIITRCIDERTEWQTTHPEEYFTDLNPLYRKIQNTSYFLKCQSKA